MAGHLLQITDLINSGPGDWIIMHSFRLTSLNWMFIEQKKLMVSLSKGSYVFKEGDIADYFYVIEEGGKNCKVKSR